ncbi:hypothetical protein LGH70_18170 [Hymenobacter sp. BT635]|uniref:Macroglobulin domain-containing protein n=1 Tax=Hymenobacter nitidus TaxID=2880929 RepID=A0ABS8AHF5_9BACT|nr:hypothetical protein [Hymenobacter nitidus]MCB2379529.1 hypothetical protein [Hymenobacter nitidus]
MITLLYILGGIAVAGVGTLLLIFSLGQRSVSYQLTLRLLDAAGRPLSPQPIVVWDRSAGPRPHQPDAAGNLVLELSESFGSSALGPLRPGVFPVRLAFPALSPLYYSFEVQRSGPVPAYQIFNDYYTYGAGQWVGDSDARGFTRRHTPSTANGTVARAVLPRGGQVPRWQATATLRRTGNTPDGRRRYTLALTLQQSGTELVRAA